MEWEQRAAIIDLLAAWSHVFISAGPIVFEVNYNVKVTSWRNAG